MKKILDKNFVFFLFVSLSECVCACVCVCVDNMIVRPRKKWSGRGEGELLKQSYPLSLQFYRYFLP